MAIVKIVIEMTTILPDEGELELITTRGYELLERYRRELGQTYRGKFIMIDLESGNYVLAENLASAAQKAKEIYPDKLLFGGPLCDDRRHYAHKGRAPYTPLRIPLYTPRNIQTAL